MLTQEALFFIEKAHCYGKLPKQARMAHFYGGEMFLLLSNDDGYLSPGLRLLAQALRSEVNRLAIFAPDRDCSGSSHSLTLQRPLAITSHGNEIWSVDGTPSDCVHLAVSGYFEPLPDMVISGINHGANLGNDVLYSGTVAAAFEGYNVGLPVLAVSNTAHRPQHLESSVQVVIELFHYLIKNPLPKNLFLNINIPDLPYREIKGFRTTVLGERHPAGSSIKADNPRGKELYWIGLSGKAIDSKEETDFSVVEEGYVSVTPLQFNLTAHRKIADVKTWLEGLQ